MEVDFDDRLSDAVRDRYDLVLRGGRIADSSMVSRPICQFKLLLVASPAYLARHGIPRTPHDLARHKLLTRRFLGGGVSPWSFKASDGGLLTIDTDHAVMTYSSPEALNQSALDGAGIAQVGAHHAWPHLRSGALKALLFDSHHAGSYEMTLQYPHRALIAPRVRVTVDYLLDYFSQLEALHLPLAAPAEYSA